MYLCARYSGKPLLELFHLILKMPILTMITSEPREIM